jgi:hypothetical protein
MRTTTCDSTRAVKIHVTLTETSSPSKSLTVAQRSREKSSFLFFHRRHKKTKELRLPPLLLPLPTKPPFPLLSIDGQGAFTISSSLAAKTISQSIISCRRRPRQENKRRSKSKGSSGLAFGWQSRKAGRVRFISHHPSSCVVFFLQSPPRSKTSSLNQKAKKQNKQKQFVHRKKKGNKKQRSLNKTLVCSVPFRHC